MNNVRIGIVGLRNNGKGHARKTAALPGCQLVAGADADLTRAQFVVDLEPEARVYTEASELFADEHVDANRPTSCVEHFVRVIRGEESLIPTAEQGMLSLQVLEALYESAETGKQVRL